MSELVEVEFTEESGLRGNTETLVTIEEAKAYREAGKLVIPEDDGQALTLDGFYGEDYDC